MDVIKVKGTLEHLGPSLHKHIEADQVSSGSAHYAYMRLDGADGVSHMIDHVAVAGHVAAFMRLGGSGTFYFARMKIGKFERNVLFAVATDSKKIAELGYVAHAISQTKWEFRKALLYIIAILIGGLMLAIVLIGIPVALWALYLLIRTLMRSFPAHYPDPAECRHLLQEDGFSG